MSDISELETYLSISSKKFEIYLLNINNLENLYKKELILSKESEIIDVNILN